MTEKKINEDEIRQFFEKKVTDSGHTFEGTVNKRLNDLGLRVKSEEFYYDKDEEKGRNIDFLAIDNSPPLAEQFEKPQDEIQVSGQLRFIIECKSLPDHGWIFFGDEEDESDFVDNGKFSSEEMGDAIIDMLVDESDPEIHFASTYAEYILANGTKSDGARPKYTKNNNLYESCVSVIKASISNRDEYERLEKYFRSKGTKRGMGVIFFQPIVVFNGHMYRATNGEDDNVHLESIDMVKIRRQYVSPKYDVRYGTIHVVSVDKLEEYVEKMKKYYWNGDFIRKHQNELIKIHKSSQDST